MQWILNRVVAMSGAADVNDDFDSNDDDDDHISLKEDEDFDMLDASDSEFEWQSPHTRSHPMSSP